MDKTVKEMLEKPTESEIVKAYTKGFDTGVETARQKGEYTEEDMKRTIKENFDLGYEMAKNKYERPKGEWLHPYETNIACECSICKRQMPIPDYFNFCPNCGADMRGGGDK